MSKVLSIISLILIISASLWYTVINAGNIKQTSGLLDLVASPGGLVMIAILFMAISLVSDNSDDFTHFSDKGWPTQHNKLNKSRSECAYYKDSALLPSCIDRETPSDCNRCQRHGDLHSGAGLDGACQPGNNSLRCQ